MLYWKGFAEKFPKNKAFKVTLVCIGVSAPSQKHHPSFSLSPVLNRQTVQAPLFSQSPPPCRFFMKKLKSSSRKGGEEDWRRGGVHTMCISLFYVSHWSFIIQLLWVMINLWGYLVAIWYCCLNFMIACPRGN